jgi:hypothetical protein
LSEDDANDYIILVVIDGYLLIALHDFRKNKRKRAKLKRKVPAAKRRWMISQDY